MLVEQLYGETRDRLTGEVISRHTGFSCAHCSKKVQLHSLKNHGYSTCWNCDDGMGRGLICDNPACRETCRPFLKKLDEMEARERLRSWV